MKLKLSYFISMEYLLKQFHIKFAKFSKKIFFSHLLFVDLKLPFCFIPGFIFDSHSVLKKVEMTAKHAENPALSL